MTGLLVWSSEALPVRSRSKQLRDAREEEKNTGGAHARIWCRDCGEEMIQVSMHLKTTRYCKSCGIKASVHYEETPEVRTI